MTSTHAAHELSSYLSCLDKEFGPEIFVEHGGTWARYARAGGRQQIADAIDKRTAEARRECAAKSAATPGRASASAADPAELRAVVDRAYTAIAAESQANVDAMWADVVVATGHGRAPAPKESPPTRSDSANASARRWPSAAESDRVWSEIAADLNASEGVKPRGLSKPK